MTTFVEMMADPSGNTVPDYIEQLRIEGWKITCTLAPGPTVQDKEVMPVYKVEISSAKWDVCFKAYNDADLKEAIDKWMETGIVPQEKLK